MGARPGGLRVAVSGVLAGSRAGLCGGVALGGDLVGLVDSAAGVGYVVDGLMEQERVIEVFKSAVGGGDHRALVDFQGGALGPVIANERDHPVLAAGAQQLG